MTLPTRGVWRERAETRWGRRWAQRLEHLGFTVVVMASFAQLALLPLAGWTAGERQTIVAEAGAGRYRSLLSEVGALVAYELLRVAPYVAAVVALRLAWGSRARVTALVGCGRPPAMAKLERTGVMAALTGAVLLDEGDPGHALVLGPLWGSVFAGVVLAALGAGLLGALRERADVRSSREGHVADGAVS